MNETTKKEKQPYKNATEGVFNYPFPRLCLITVKTNQPIYIDKRSITNRMKFI